LAASDNDTASSYGARLRLGTRSIRNADWFGANGVHEQEKITTTAAQQCGSARRCRGENIDKSARRESHPDHHNTWCRAQHRRGQGGGMLPYSYHTSPIGWSPRSRLLTKFLSRSRTASCEHHAPITYLVGHPRGEAAGLPLGASW